MATISPASNNAEVVAGHYRLTHVRLEYYTSDEERAKDNTEAKIAESSSPKVTLKTSYS